MAKSYTRGKKLVVFKSRRIYYSYAITSLVLESYIRKYKNKKDSYKAKTNGQQKVQSIKENRYNEVLKLVIEKEKENEMQELVIGKDKNEQFDLVIEGHTSQ